MPILRPSALGGVISAFDSDSLSTEFNINDPTFGSTPVGSKVWNVDVGSYFTLTVSSASTVTDDVLSVLDYDGLRWIKDSVTVPDNSITAAMLKTSDKPEITAFMNTATDLLPGLMPAAALSAESKVGANLTDTDTTVQSLAGKFSRVILPAGTLTANRVLRLGNSGVTLDNVGSLLEVVCLDTSVNTYTIKDDASGTDLYVKKASDSAQCFRFYLNPGDSHWIANTRIWV